MNHFKLESLIGHNQHQNLSIKRFIFVLYLIYLRSRESGVGSMGGDENHRTPDPVKKDQTRTPDAADHLSHSTPEPGRRDKPPHPLNLRVDLDIQLENKDSPSPKLPRR